jgi:hypothetical protein
MRSVDDAHTCDYCFAQRDYVHKWVYQQSMRCYLYAGEVSTRPARTALVNGFH